MTYSDGETDDVIIAGAGVVGAAIARELAKYALRVSVIEKEPDAAWATSGRNSGVLHSGINYAPGTKRAVLSVRGNAMMDRLCSELNVPLKRIGKLTVALDDNDLAGLHKLREQGLANGVPGMELLDNAAARRIQPGVEGVLALWTPSSAIISPYGLAIALAENANKNGVKFFLSRRVESVRFENGIFFVGTRGSVSGEKETFASKIFVNAAGLHADAVSRMLGVNDNPIYPCRGEYFVLDKRLEGKLTALIYPVPGPNDPGLGIHLTPTADGNILIGPSAGYISGGDAEDYATTRTVMESLRREGRRLLPSLAAGDFIRAFAGVRPKLTPPDVGGNADFIIDEPRAGFIRLQGIESPGLTSSPAIAEVVRDMIGERVGLKKRNDFVVTRRAPAVRFADSPREVQMRLARDDPEYGEIVCRCEQVTKREVRDAIENRLGARTLLSVKYRSRAMMGRCQGGFCLPRIVRMLREEYGYKEKRAPGLKEIW
jgi:glycerol-3-phosphate dehydrogenase